MTSIIMKNPTFGWHSEAPHPFTHLQGESNVLITFMFDSEQARLDFWRQVAVGASVMMEAAEGQCDCGATYDVGSRFDHDADSGQCWDCSDRDFDTMTATEMDEYLNG